MSSMSKVRKIFNGLLLVTSMSMSTAWAEETTSMPGMDHSEMEGMDQQNMQDMNHDNMQHDMHSDQKPAQMEGMDHQNMPGMNHGDMQHDMHSDQKPAQMEGMDHQNMPGMNHGDMQHDMHSDKKPAQMEGMDHHDMQHDMSGMNHGDMQHDMSGMNHGMSGMSHGAMQGGSAPANARDPHAFSDGYTLVSSPYVLPGPRQLRLADEHNFGSLMFDRLEAVKTSKDKFGIFDFQAWYGGDYNRAVLKSEGEYNNRQVEEVSTEVLWAHAVSAYWNSQLGVRYDSGEAPDRYWLAFGLQGLAPYWFEMDITGYLGTAGQASLNVEAEYELLLTQKLILQPRIEANAYGKDDKETGVGSGVSDVSLGLRLRYELKREIAPYVGVEWSTALGRAADYLKLEDQNTSETKAVAGVRFWF